MSKLSSFGDLILFFAQESAGPDLNVHQLAHKARSPGVQRHHLEQGQPEWQGESGTTNGTSSFCSAIDHPSWQKGSRNWDVTKVGMFG